MLIKQKIKRKECSLRLQTEDLQKYSHVTSYLQVFSFNPPGTKFAVSVKYKNRKFYEQQIKKLRGNFQICRFQNAFNTFVVQNIYAF